MEYVRKAIGCLALLAAIATAAAQNYGSFGPLLTPAAGTWPANCLAVHMVHMPGGNVLIWGKRDYTFTKLYVRNSYTGQFLSEPSFGQWTVPGVDLFCAGHTLLPDGRVLIAGGTVNTDDGIRNTYLFDPVSLSWSDSGLMAQGRYYPSLVTLHDGNVAVVSGWREPDVPPVWADEVEIFHTATGAWTHFRPDPFIQPHYYPFLFTVYSAADPDTPRVFMAGKSLDRPADMSTHLLRITSPQSGEWLPLGGSSAPVQGSAAIVIVPSTDPVHPGIVWKFGGSGSGEEPVTDEVRYINLADSQPLWAEATPLLEKRADCNVVVLPNGLVAVVGGSREQDHLQNYGSRVKTIEIYQADPANNGTIAVSPDMDRSRMYHSTVILQPDASLLLAGGQFKENGVDGSEYNGQVFYPPYFSQIRPTITGTDPLTMSYGSLFTVYTNDTTGIAKVTMLRLSATTHDADMNARFINLTEHSRTSNSITVKTPFHPAIAPPGDYMLFLVTDGGVPSMARYVRIS